jgi:hypothetical protein
MPNWPAATDVGNRHMRSHGEENPCSVAGSAGRHGDGGLRQRTRPRWRIEGRADHHGLFSGRRGKRLAHSQHQERSGVRGGRRHRPEVLRRQWQKQENQIKAIRSFIQQHVDVIAFSPVVRDRLGHRAARRPRTRDSGDPHRPRRRLSGDRRLQDLPRLRLRRGGPKAGDWVVKQYQQRTGAGQHRRARRAPPAPTPAIDRSKGFAEAIAANPNLKVIASQTGDFTRSGGKQVMEAFLKANPKIDVVFAHNDDMGLGAIEAIEAAGLKVPEGRQDHRGRRGPRRHAGPGRRQVQLPRRVQSRCSARN